MFHGRKKGDNLDFEGWLELEEKRVCMKESRNEISLVRVKALTGNT